MSKGVSCIILLNMKINYRRANENDKKSLYDLGVLSNTYSLDHAHKDVLFWDGWEADFAEEVEEELANSMYHIYVAETENNGVVGFILAVVCTHCKNFEIDQIFVKEEFRKNKVGKNLVDLIIEDGKKLGMPLKLEVYKTNTSAIKFYEKYGFKEDGVILRLKV